MNCDDIKSSQDGLSVPETIRKKEINAQRIVEHIKTYTVRGIQENENDLIKPYPNTYTFTKNLAERLLDENRGDLPMVIIRPSIVGAAYKDPMNGWVDNLAALSGFIFVFGIGLIHDAPGKFSNAANFIPVDICSNAIIAVTVKHAKQNSLLICHAASPGENPITHSEVVQSIIDFSERNPFD